MSAPEPPAPRGARASLLEEIGFEIRGDLEAIRLLGSAHTLANYQTAFYDFELADNNSFEQWSAEGGRDQMHGRCRTSSAEARPARE
jgi:trimethylamine:corrinoid methyltransferase-like protein